MKNTPFRSAHTLLSARRIADFRILLIALLATLSATQTRAADPIVWDFAQMEKQETWTEGNTYTIESTDGSKTKMLYTAGGSDAIKDQNNVRCLRQNGTSNGTKRTFELQVPAGTGTLAIEYTANQGKWDITDGQNGESLLTGYAGGTTSANITVTTSLYFTTKAKGYITKITWTPSLPDTYYTFHQGVDGAADTWTIRLFKQVETSTEWQLSDYTFLASSDNLSFYVGKNGNFIDGSSATKPTTAIQFAALQGSNNNNYYPGDGAIGTLRIYSDSQSENYYIGFFPTYMMTWGIEGCAPWETAEFSHKENTTYETTELVTLPNDFADKTYKYYVGTKKHDESVIWIAGKSSTDEMKGVTGIKKEEDNPSYAFLNGAKGRFCMYDNSGDNNWYCYFIPYYNYILYKDDGTIFFASDYVSSEATDKATTFPTDVPTKEGYKCVGWARTQNATSAEITAGTSYTYWTPNDKFYPVWIALPAINQQPTGGKYCAGTDVTLTVEATAADGGTLTYQWFLGKNAIPGATSNTYTITNIQAAGTYTCQITNTKNGYTTTVTSDEAKVTLYTAPAIKTQPESKEVEVNTEATLSVTASGDITGYQWYTCDQDGNNETAIDGATSTTYSVTPTEAVTTYYKVTITGACESVSSDIVSITAKEKVVSSCADIAKATLNAEKNGMTAGIGEVVVNGGEASDGYMKLNSDKGTITIAATGSYAPIQDGDVLYVECYNKGNNGKALGFKIKSTACTETIPSKEIKTIQHPITATDIEKDGTIILTRTGSDDRYVSVRVERCGLKPSAELSYTEPSVYIKFSSEATLPQTLTNPNSVAVTYSSSNPEVATVDAEGKVTCLFTGETTITASFAGNDDYAQGQASYTLTITPPAGKDYTATLFADKTEIGCDKAILTITTDPTTVSDPTYEWYLDDTKIDDATAETYTTDIAGTYKVLVHANGYPQWSNTVTITKTEPKAVEIKRLTPFHYYRNGCDYTGDTDHPIRHLFLVNRNGLTPSEGKTAYTIRLSKKATDGTTSDITGIETSGWLYPNGDTLMMDLRQFPASMVADWAKEDKGTQGDTLVITLVPLNSCGDYDEAKSVSMDIIVTEKDRRALAFIVSGCDPTSATPYEPVLGGDFFADINKRNLWLRTGKETWDENKDGVLWGGLRASDTFIPTAVNGYAEFDIFNYEPFDIIMLTDYVRTNATGNAGYAYFDKLAQLVDYRPILSLKSHMSRPELTGWRAKGFLADPVSLTGAINMKVLCLGHTILSGIDGQYFNKETSLLKVLTETGYEDNKGLQGFLSRDLVGFVNIGYIDSVAGKPLAEPLIACCERQNVLNARMMILSINSEATPKLTPGGVEAIRAMLYYLMETDETKIQDCSNVFDNNKGTGDHNWSNTANWTYGHLPLLASNVQIIADCNVDMMDAAAGVLKIESGKRLTINADASLRVAKRFGQREGNLRIKPLPNGDYSIVTIKANADGAGTLIHSAFAADATHPEGYEIPATVEYYSIASGAPDNCQYQWMASPVQNIPQAEVPFAGAWVYGWDTETHTWGNYLRNGDSMTAFDAYCFTQRTGGKNTYTIQGKLVNIQTDTIALSYNATLPAARRGINVIGNSWTAPINISGWTAADFKNCDASIILFNTGFDPTGEGAQVTDGTNLAGQYSVIPVNTTSKIDARYQVIPAMQAFQVNANGAGAKLTMDYDRLVRTDKVNRQPMHIQRRWNAEGTESTDPEGITTTLRIYVKGERYGDQVYIFRNADCTAGYDNGWDGHKILGAAAALQLFVESEGERYAVSTQPELAGTRLAFFKGEDETYTMEFEYDGDEPLYLYDSNTDHYTPVSTGNTYFFRSETTKLEHRFLLTDSRPKEPSGPTTGIVEVNMEDNSLILSNTTQDPVTLSIFDAAGRLCYQKTLHTPLATIPVPDTPGVYMIEAASRTQHVTRKIIL